MNYNLFFDNNLNIYYICIGSGFILSCSLYYWFRSNYISIPTRNMEAFTHEEIEAIMNENSVTIINSENIEAISDSDSDTDTEFASEYESTFGSDNTSDTESILDDLDLFFMPNVDLDVCPIEELKFFEFSSLYSREIIEHSISDAEIMEFISWFTPEQLLTNWINELFVSIITLL